VEESCGVSKQAGTIMTYIPFTNGMMRALWLLTGKPFGWFEFVWMKLHCPEIQLVDLKMLQAWGLIVSEVEDGYTWFKLSDKHKSRQ
jgi:hypothetical protein